MVLAPFFCPETLAACGNGHVTKSFAALVKNPVSHGMPLPKHVDAPTES